MAENCFDAQTDANGHAYVDLGLPSGTLWATCNIGATKPEEYGDYFAWGETSTKDTYDWTTYKYSKGDEDELTKYCDDSDYGYNYGYNGFTDSLNTLGRRVRRRWVLRQLLVEFAPHGLLGRRVVLLLRLVQLLLGLLRGKRQSVRGSVCPCSAFCVSELTLVPSVHGLIVETHGRAYLRMQPVAPFVSTQ